ncbi:MAG: DUF3667 domain-containing protein [Gemmatimonadales bacterium]|nr:MAG: DUF3667 domain-containing protein [Gemmatimonadales bacterium]
MVRRGLGGGGPEPECDEACWRTHPLPMNIRLYRAIEPPRGPMNERTDGEEGRSESGRPSHEEEPCRNCGDPTPGAYCPNCGQRKVDVQVSLRALVGDLLEDQLGVGHKLPITLVALFFRPGHLTRRYLEGKVVRYIRPFKLYLVSSLILFLLVGFLSMRGVTEFGTGWGQAGEGEPATLGEVIAEDMATPEEEEGTQDIPTDPADPQEDEEELPWYERVEINTANERLDALLEARLVRLGRMGTQDAIREILRTLLSYAPTLMFLLLPVFAGAFKLLYIRGPWYYVEHFVFVLHIHAFLFGTFTLSLLAGGIGLEVVSSGLAIWAVIYIYLALRRVYGQGHLKTAIKYWTLGWIYFWILVAAIPPLLIVTFLMAGA